MASWTSLPPELRLAILEAVAGPPPNTAQHTPRSRAPHGDGYTLAPDGRGFAWAPDGHGFAWAPYAAVSREWQGFFERRTFAALALGNADLKPFRAAVAHDPGRLAYVGRLQLTIDLPRYDRIEGGIDEHPGSTERHDTLFSVLLWRLLRTLSAWKEPGPADGPPLRMRDDALFRTGTLTSAVGLQLELGVRCVSDTEYYNHRIPLPQGPIRNCFRIASSIPCDNVDDWVRNVDALRVFPPAGRRVLGRRPLVLGKGPDDRRRRHHRRPLPVAPIVRKLVLGRRFTRAIHPNTLARLLGESFPRVQSAHLEPWRPVTATNRYLLERGYSALLKRLPPSLDRLSVFVESHCILHYYEKYGRPTFSTTPDSAPAPVPAPPRPALRRKTTRNLALQLAAASCRLAMLNVSFLAEADDVLAAIIRMPAATAAWPRLHTLILTSSTLAPTTPPEDIAALLATAAAAAARMPHLRQLELWHAHGPHACVFTVDGAQLRLCATWPGAAMALTQDVLDAWQAVRVTWPDQRLFPPVRAIFQYWPYKKEKGVADARQLVFDNNTTLVREAVFEQSRRDMAQERGW